MLSAKALVDIAQVRLKEQRPAEVQDKAALDRQGDFVERSNFAHSIAAVERQSSADFYEVDFC